MNVNDYRPPENLPECMLTEIFKAQHMLAQKYLDIEANNGLLQTRDMPVNIHDKMGQARIKDEFWRATEEVCEALEALDEFDFVHFHEELADAMHFLVEGCLLADYKPEVEYLNPGEDALSMLFTESRIMAPRQKERIRADEVHYMAMCFIKQMGLAANCLKNKPWKQTHMLTDERKFKVRMNNAFRAFIDLCKAAGFDSASLYNMYMRKHQVNKFRQGSGY